jgi:hypothetical protein
MKTVISDISPSHQILQEAGRFAYETEQPVNYHKQRQESGQTEV